MSDTLTETEQSIIADGLGRGFIIASGMRIVAIVAYRQECRRRGVPTVEIRVGARQSKIMVDGVVVWKGAKAEAERRAPSYAAPVVPEQGMLFPERAGGDR